MMHIRGGILLWMILLTNFLVRQILLLLLSRFGLVLLLPILNVFDLILLFILTQVIYLLQITTTIFGLFISVIILVLIFLAGLEG